VLGFDQYWVTPRQNVLKENILQRNEILSEVVIPPPAAGQKSTFIKFKERAVFDFAVSSVAAVVTMDGNTVKAASIVLGGVSPTPHQSPEAEKALIGKSLDQATIQAAASAAVSVARPLTDNAYKVDLTRGLVQQALTALAT
jgi:xanthine dehydrogenase YagS FAD-binding subunit